MQQAVRVEGVPHALAPVEREIEAHGGAALADDFAVGAHLRFADAVFFGEHLVHAFLHGIGPFTAGREYAKHFRRFG